MADTPAIELEIRADLVNLRADIAQMNTMLRGLADGAGSTGPGFERAGKGSDGFYNSLRNLKMEAVQHQRVFGYFGTVLQGFGVASREAGSALIGLGAGLASGMWIMAAVEAGKLLVDVFRDIWKEARETKEAFNQVFESIRSQSDDAEFSMKRLELKARGWTDAMLEALEASRRAGTITVPKALVPEGGYLGHKEGEDMKLSVDEAIVFAGGEVRRLQAELFQTVGRVYAMQPVKTQTFAEILGSEDFRDQRAKIMEFVEMSQQLYALGSTQRKAAQKKDDTEVQLERLRLAKEGATEEKKIQLEFEEYVKKFPQLEVEAAQARDRKLLALRERQAQEAQRIMERGRKHDQDSQEAFDADLRKSAEQRLQDQMDMAQVEGDPFKIAGLKRDMAMLEGKKKPQVIDAEYLKEIGQAYSAVGESIGNIFGTLGGAMKGTFGELTQWFGKLIQQAIQLAVAISAASGPWGWLQAGVAAATLIATLASVPKFERGTDFVPGTGLAILHRGEAVLPTGGPAEAFRAGRGGGQTVIQIQAWDARDVRRSFRGNRGELARAMRELREDGRRG